MIATSGFLSPLEITKFVSDWDSAPDPTGEAYSAHPDLIAGLRDPTCKRRGEKSRKGVGERKRGILVSSSVGLMI